MQLEQYLADEGDKCTACGAAFHEGQLILGSGYAYRPMYCNKACAVDGQARDVKTPAQRFGDRVLSGLLGK